MVEFPQTREGLDNYVFCVTRKIEKKLNKIIFYLWMTNEYIK